MVHDSLVPGELTRWKGEAGASRRSQNQAGGPRCPIPHAATGSTGTKQWAGPGAEAEQHGEGRQELQRALSGVWRPDLGFQKAPPGAVGGEQMVGTARKQEGPER